MKNPVKNIAISTLLTLALGLFMTAFAQNAKAQSAINVTGTTWVGTDSDGDYYEYTFVAGGVLHFKSPSGVLYKWHLATRWKLDLYADVLHGYKQEILGTIGPNQWHAYGWRSWKRRRQNMEMGCGPEIQSTP